MSARLGRGRRLLLAGALALGAACSGGLLLDEGNPFPCDYAAGEEVRDTQCTGGWRCGIDSRCHPDTPEEAARGPEPRFSGASRRFPTLLDGEARFVALDPRFGGLLVTYEDGGTHYATPGEAWTVSGAQQVAGAAFVAGRVAVVESAGGQRLPGLKVGIIHPTTRALALVPVTTLDGGAVPGVRGLRTMTLPDAGMLSVLLSGGGAGEVDLATGRFRPYPAGNIPLVESGTPGGQDGGVLDPGLGGLGTLGLYVDARPVPEQYLLPPPLRGETPVNAASLVPVVVTPTSFLWRSTPPDAGHPEGLWRVLNTSEPIGYPAQDGGIPGPSDRWLLRHGEGGGVWALKRPQGDRDVLSTWVLLRSQARPEDPRLERAWDDCSPCGSGRLVTFTPVVDGAVGVEVLCESRGGTRSLLRVVGASVVSPTDACLTQSLTSPIDLTEVASARVDGGLAIKPGAVDESLSIGVSLGGAHGQLWRGRRLSGLVPLYLDRAPTRAIAFQEGLLAYTPDFLALEAPQVPRERRTGLTVVPLGEVDGGANPVSVASGEKLGALVEGVQGWLLLSTGQLARVVPGGESQDVTLASGYGPRLLGPDGTPAPGPYVGQGLAVDAGVSLVLAASDQLYHLELSAADLQEEPGLAPGVGPRLTPEPGFPVRSLARDRTAVPGGEEPRVRGWVATSRSLFEYAQSEAGLWSLTPLTLGSGEPVEVWSLEGPGRAYGRVGLRDGQVLKLPEGLPLTGKLPEGERVVDYADLVGWPVALTQDALYGTEATQREDGREGLLRWRPLPLPAEVTREALSGARIEVVREAGVPVLYLFTHTGFTYRVAEGTR